MFSIEMFALVVISCVIASVIAISMYKSGKDEAKIKAMANQQAKETRVLHASHDTPVG